MVSYEKLLAKVDNKASYWHRNPLRAVVKLHKPYVDHIIYCEDCEMTYPCTTIQTIMEALE